jgi:hypothetical protein
MAKQRTVSDRLNEGFGMLEEREDGPRPNDMPRQRRTQHGNYEGNAAEDDDFHNSLRGRNGYPW